jgi:hypothetical protein
VSVKQSASQVLDVGVRDGIDLCIRIAQSPYIAKEMFLEYVRDVFVPTVEANRDLLGCQAKAAITFCDNCCCHYSDDILQELAHHGILLITYHPHTSRIFEVLDVMLFGCLKSVKQYLPRNQELDTCFPPRRDSDNKHDNKRIIGKSRFWVRQEKLHLLSVSQGGKIRRGPEFQEVWRLDYPEARLSQRRRQQKSGWLNQSFFRKEYTDMGGQDKFSH